MIASPDSRCANTPLCPRQSDRPTRMKKPGLLQEWHVGEPPPLEQQDEAYQGQMRQ
jgi:hypothetical protein